MQARAPCLDEAPCAPNAGGSPHSPKLLLCVAHLCLMTSYTSTPGRLDNRCRMRATLRLLLALPDVLDELLVHLPQSRLHTRRLVALVEDNFFGRVVHDDVGPLAGASLTDAPWILALVAGVLPDAAVA